MHDRGLAALKRRRFRPKTTDSNHHLLIAENVLDRDFSHPAPNQVWIGDITYIPTVQDWQHLAVLLDLHSGLGVDWAMSDRIDRHLVLGALSMAVTNQGVPAGGVLHHSDRGSQYASDDYRKALEGYGFKASLGRRGNCWDNAVSESFFPTLKVELFHQCQFATHAEPRITIFEYIEVFYKHQRRNSTLGYVIPAQFKSN